MSKIIAQQDFKIHLTLTEGEARALDALVGYGGKPFIDVFLPVFYEKMGKHYMKPYENDLAVLFDNIRNNIRFSLHKIDEARNVFVKVNPNS